MSAFVDLGMSKEKFLSEYYEQRPLHVKKAIDSMNFSLADIDEVLNCTDWGSTRFKFNDGRVIPSSKYTENYNQFEETSTIIRNDAVYDLFKQGASLVANRVEKQSQKIRTLCDFFEHLTNASTAANGYLTFSDVSPFGAHWDTHDVFAVQLIGRKQWSVFQNTFELPTVNHKSRFHKSEVPETPVINTILEPGDLLYLPRGWWHSAVGFNERTFHVAIGIHPPLGLNYVQWVTEQVLQEDPVARRSFEFALSESNFAGDICRKLSKAVDDKVMQQKFRNKIALERRHHINFNLAAFVDHEFKISAKDLLRSNVDYSNLSENDSILFNGKIILFSHLEKYILQFLHINGTSEFAQLVAGIDGSQKGIEAAILHLGENGVLAINE